MTVLLRILKDSDTGHLSPQLNRCEVNVYQICCMWAAICPLSAWAPQTCKIIQHMWRIKLGLLWQPLLFHCSTFLRPFYILESVHQPATIIPRWACLALLLELFFSLFSQGGLVAWLEGELVVAVRRTQETLMNIGIYMLHKNSNSIPYKHKCSIHNFMSSVALFLFFKVVPSFWSETE